jgi:hypothetical protein
MKTPILKPGFEFIFSLSLLAILGLPPMLMAQNQKDVEIKIENGDTTVNGKNIKELSASDRISALKDINHISGDLRNNNRDRRNIYRFKRRDTLGGMMKSDGRAPMLTEDIVINNDSLGNVVEMRAGKPGSIRKRVRLEARNNDGAPDRLAWIGRDDITGPGRPMMRLEHRNTQNFNYVNTDNDGISTRISFHVSEASNDDLKRMPRIEGPKLEIADLNIVPEFSTGKTLLLFNLPSKAAAEVTLMDSEGKTIWAEKSTGTAFSKSFVMGLNGIYYLQVKQGNGIAIKRITKEE